MTENQTAHEALADSERAAHIWRIGCMLMAVLVIAGVLLGLWTGNNAWKSKCFKFHCPHVCGQIDPDDYKFPEVQAEVSWSNPKTAKVYAILKVRVVGDFNHKQGSIVCRHVRNLAKAFFLDRDQDVKNLKDEHVRVALGVYIMKFTSPVMKEVKQITIEDIQIAPNIDEIRNAE